VHSLDLDILKFLSIRENHDIYGHLITKNLCTKESWTLVNDYNRYYKEFPLITEIGSDFDMWLRVTAHPSWKPDTQRIYTRIQDNALRRAQPDRVTFKTQLDKLKIIEDTTSTLSSYKKGTLSDDEFLGKLSNTSRVSPLLDSTQTYSLTAIAQEARDNKGLYWRLEDLNKSVGPIRKGDFVLVGKRPEVGGTSFLTSEVTHMMEQLPKGERGIIFTNEEAPYKIYSRIMSSALGIDYKQMMSAPAQYQQEYEQWLDGRELELHHDTQMTINSIRAKLNEHPYSIIGINILLKVGGTHQDADHDKLQALGTAMRDIAESFAPVLAIAQADPYAEGMRYIPKDKIYKSKTAVQGEADVQIMIGQDMASPLNSRFINVAKNKIPPAPCTELDLKHIQTEVEFDIGTGRFTSINYKVNSRDNHTV
jgi:hypothetical protein